MKIRAQAPAARKSMWGRAAFWMALLAIAAVFGLSSASLSAESAGSFYNRGVKAEAREDYDGAFENYQKAYAKAPKDLEYRTALYRIRITASATHVTKGRKLQEAGKDQEALAEFLRAGEIDPSNEAAQQAADCATSVNRTDAKPRPPAVLALPSISSKTSVNF